MNSTEHDRLDWDTTLARSRGCKRWSQHGPDVLDLSVAEMDLPIAAPIRAAVQDGLDRQAFGYPVPDEASGVPEAASEWLAARHGLRVSAAGVRLLPELMRGLSAAITHLTRAGSAVVVPTPTYGRFFDAIDVAGRRPIAVPMRRDGRGHRLDLDRIDGALAAGAGSVVLCHPGNPTGRVFDPDELRALSAVVAAHDARVISDEIHAPLRYGTGFTPFAALGDVARAQAITLFSATKAWNFPGLRCGLVALTNDADRAVWSALPRAAVGGMSPLGMLATRAALTAGQPWLDEALSLLDANRTLLAELFDDAGLAVGYTPPEATYLAWLDLGAFGAAGSAAALLESAGVALTGGPDHGPGGAGHVRLNFATAPDVLAAAVRRLARALAR